MVVKESSCIYFPKLMGIQLLKKIMGQRIQHEREWFLFTIFIYTLRPEFEGSLSWLHLWNMITMVPRLQRSARMFQVLPVPWNFPEFCTWNWTESYPNQSVVNIEMKTIIHVISKIPLQYNCKLWVTGPYEIQISMENNNFFYLKNKLFSIGRIKLPGQHRKLRGRIRT